MTRGKKIEVRNIYITHEKEFFAPPPPNSKIDSPFFTINEWLNAISDGKAPKTFISTYNFGIFESADEWLLFLVGENHLDIEGYNKTQIDFKPHFMFFVLPENLFKPFSREKAQQNICQQLKEYIKSKKFHHSFLSKADKITFYNSILWQQNKF